MDNARHGLMLHRPWPSPLILLAALVFATVAGTNRAAEPRETQPQSRPALSHGVEPTARAPGGPGQDQDAEAGEPPEDDAEGRAAWELAVRAYPFQYPPAEASARAAETYVQRRAAIRRLHDQRLRALVRELADTPDGSASNATLESRLASMEALPSGSWREIGPSPIYDDGSQTGFLNGNTSGRISTVAIDPAHPEVILIGASRGGIWRSADAGASWTPVADDQATLVIADIKFAPSAPGIVYAATGDNDVNFWGAGVLKSMDGGLTWNRVDDRSHTSGIPDGTVLSKIVVDPHDPDHVVASGYRFSDPTGPSVSTSLFASFDGGATWSRATIPAPGGVGQFHSLVIEEGCPSRLWSIDFLNHTLIRSTDGGVSWMTVATAGLPAFVSNTKIAVRHASCLGPAMLYASVNSGNDLAGTAGYPGVYRSIDDGATWSLPGLDPGPSGGCLGQCRYDHELFLDPVDPAYVYLLGRDLWISTDAGATWSNRSGAYDDTNRSLRGRMHADLHDVAISGVGPFASLYVASDGGLWRYDLDADTFTNLNGNLAISEFVDIAVDPDTPNRAIGGLQDNGTIHYLASEKWTARVYGDGAHGGFMQSVPGPGRPFDAVFWGGAGNLLAGSLDGGYTWAPMASNASFPRTDIALNEAAELYAPWVGTIGDHRIWHGARSLWYCDFPSGCKAGSWIKHTDNLLAFGGGVVSKIAIHNPAPGVLGPFYVANAFPRTFLQSDDGTTWNVRSAGLPDRYISAVVFDPQVPAHVWVTLQGFGTGHVFFSPDGGGTWIDRSGDLPNVAVNAIVVDPQDPNATWYVATDSGVYGTADGGATWSVVGGNLAAAWVNDLEIGPNRMLYAATGGRSAWRIALPGSSPTPPVISSTAASQLGVEKKPGGGIELSWGSVSPADLTVNVYQGSLGDWYSHKPVACGLSASAVSCTAGRCAADVQPASGSHYYLITASGTQTEGPAGDEGWVGPDHVIEPLYAVQEPCGGGDTPLPTTLKRHKSTRHRLLLP